MRHSKLTRFVVALPLLLLHFLPASAVPNVSDDWRVVKDDSDDPHDRLKGLAMLRSAPNTLESHDRSRAGPTRQAKIYNEIELNKQRHLRDTEADVGALSSVLFTDSLRVSPTAEGYEVLYEGGFKRVVNPRPGGPVYSAKGDEFTTDQLGRSMIYWRGSTLVIETLLAPRGNMTEEFTLEQPIRKLKVQTKITNPDWLLDADIIRVFEPAAQHKD